MTSSKKNDLTTFKLKKKMNLTIGVRSRRRVVPGYKFGFSGSESYGEFEYLFGSVGSGRNIELMDLTRGFNREL